MLRLFPAISSLVLAGALGFVSAPARADGDACSAGKFTFSQVESACKSGGRKAAKDVMNRVVKEQKAAGNNINCATCHANLKDFAQKANAEADLRKYLK